MSRASTDQIIAFVELQRSIDRLLVEADRLRQSRDRLARFTAQAHAQPIATDSTEEEGRHVASSD